MEKLPDFAFEEIYWGKGIDLVVGVDEVGRGSLAGPVVAGAAFIKTPAAKRAILKLGINDSKRLKEGKRRELAKIIPKYFNSAIGQASVEEINTLGIVRATGRAMRRAVNSILYQVSSIKHKNNKIPDTKYVIRDTFLLVDGYKMKYLPGGLRRQLNIIKGDQKSVSIAAASIIAKVYRDTLMKKLGRRYPVYKWGRNKGYGTKLHIKALEKYGYSDLHRSVFRWHVV